MVSEPCPYERIRFYKYHGFAGYCFPFQMRRAFKLPGEYFPVQALRVKVQGQLEEWEMVKVLLSEYEQLWG